MSHKLEEPWPGKCLTAKCEVHCWSLRTIPDPVRGIVLGYIRV